MQELSGPSYQTCRRWPDATQLWPDAYYPTPRGARMTEGGALELENNLCGIWRIDPASPDTHTPIVSWPTFDQVSIGPTPVPYDLDVDAMYAADSGGESFVCVDVQGSSTGSGMREKHVEVWSISADGGSSERIALPPPLYQDSVGKLFPEKCGAIAADRDSVFFNAGTGGNAVLYRIDRATKATTLVTKWFGDVSTEMLLTKDAVLFAPWSISVADHDLVLTSPNFYLPVLRVDRATLTPKVILAGRTFHDPLRYDFKIDGDTLYWLDGLSLRRMSVLGGEVETIVEGDFTAETGAFPDYAVLDRDIYFGRVTKDSYALQRTAK